MPGMYPDGDFDLAGFSVGAMERGTALPRDVAVGDVLLGLPSSGVHSNGYSLVRKIVDQSGLGWDAESPFGDGALGEALLAPTRIYVQQALAAIRKADAHAFAHITGGGLTENIPRMLPDGIGAEVDLNAWELPPIFQWLTTQAGLDQAEARFRGVDCDVCRIRVADLGLEGLTPAAAAAMLLAVMYPIILNTALALGLDPDSPETLAKVTKTT